MTVLREGQHLNESLRVTRVLERSTTIVYILENVQRQGPLAPAIVCAKTLRAEHLRDESARRHFLREAEQWLLLGRYEHILWAFGYGEIDGRPCVLTQLADGGSLRDMVAAGFSPQTSPLDRARAIIWTFGICLGILHIYKRTSMPHGDITADNIVFTLQIPKLSDFGLAAVVEKSPTRAAAVDIAGFVETVWYMFTNEGAIFSEIVAREDLRQVPRVIQDIVRLAQRLHHGDPIEFFDQCRSLLSCYWEELAGKPIPTPEAFHLEKQQEIASLHRQVLEGMPGVVKVIAGEQRLYEPSEAYLQRAFGLANLGRLDASINALLPALQMLSYLPDSEASRTCWRAVLSIIEGERDVSKRCQLFARAADAWGLPEILSI